MDVCEQTWLQLYKSPVMCPKLFKMKNGLILWGKGHNFANRGAACIIRGRGPYYVICFILKYYNQLKILPFNKRMTVSTSWQSL